MKKNKNWYDAQCKKMLTNKKVLINILKREIEEYKHLSYDEILKLISEPQLDVKEDSEFLETGNVEDYGFNQELVMFDVILYAKLPDSEETVGLVINFEVQGDIPKYPILKRAYYYLSRLIARQKGMTHGFQKSEYGKLKKVVGIWIIRTGKKKKGMLNRYRMVEECAGTEIHYP